MVVRRSAAAVGLVSVVRVVRVVQLVQAMVLRAVRLIEGRIERIELLPSVVGGGVADARRIVVVEAAAGRIGRTDLLRFAALEERDAHLGALQSAIHTRTDGERESVVNTKLPHLCLYTLE